MLHEGIGLVAEKATKYQDRRLQTSFAESNALFDQGNSKGCCTCRKGDARHLNSTVTIGVGLDDGHHPCRLYTLHNLPDIVFDGAEIHLGVRWSHPVFLPAPPLHVWLDQATASAFLV
jgi:hypothetical protein